MSYQNYNRCQGWANPSTLFYGPKITGLSGYQSPSGSNTVVAITGTSFYSYSVIRFGTFTPTVFFINSELLEFYVPNTLSSGTFPVQVCNGSICSNIMTYTIDNASGYWLLQSSGAISNTNSNGVSISWISRGAPITIDNTADTYTSSNPYSIQNSQNWVICNGGTNNYVTYISLPTGTVYGGRELMFKTIGGGIMADTSNVIPLNGGTATNVIISGASTWATLVYNGDTDIWTIMQAN